MPRRRSALIAAAATAGAVAATAAVVAGRRWRANDDLDDFSYDGCDDRKIDTTDGATIAASVLGPDDGAPVVLVHGWTNNRQIWMPVARRLADNGHRVVVYDQRGHGESTVGAEGISLDRMALDLRDVLTELDLRDAVIVGHSMGGMATQALAAIEPDVLRERARALVLVATAAHGISRGGRRRDAIAVRAVGNSRPLGRVGRTFGPYVARGVVGRDARWSHLVASTRWFEETTPEVRAAGLRAMFEMDVRGAVAALGLPTTVMVGTRDTLTPARLSKRLAAEIPNVDAVTLPGAGHMLPLEASDQVVEVIERHLAAPS